MRKIYNKKYNLGFFTDFYYKKSCKKDSKYFYFKIKKMRFNDKIKLMKKKEYLHFDIIVIGAGVAGLLSINKLLSFGQNLNILLISENIGGSLLLTDTFGLGLLREVSFDSKKFMKKISKILLDHRVIFSCDTVFRIENKKKICVYSLKNSFYCDKLIIATGKMNSLYSRYCNNKNIFDSYQLEYNFNYQKKLFNEEIVVYSKNINNPIKPLYSNKEILIDTIDSIEFTTNNIYIFSRGEKYCTKYLIFYYDTFVPNRIPIEGNQQKVYMVGDVNLKSFGVLNAINSAIEVGEIIKND